MDARALDDEQRALRRVINAFLDYPRAAEEDVVRWERSYSRMPNSQKALLPHLPAKYAAIRRCISANTQFINAMVQAFDPPFSLDENTVTVHSNSNTNEYYSNSQTNGFENAFGSAKRKEGEYEDAHVQKLNSTEMRKTETEKGKEEKEKVKHKQFLNPHSHREEVAEERSLNVKKEDREVMDVSLSTSQSTSAMDSSLSEMKSNHSHNHSSVIASDVQMDKIEPHTDESNETLLLLTPNKKSMVGKEEKAREKEKEEEEDDDENMVREERKDTVESDVSKNEILKQSSGIDINQTHPHSSHQDSKSNQSQSQEPLHDHPTRRSSKSLFDVLPSHQRTNTPLRPDRVPLADVDKVRCILRNIVRDWAEEGVEERKQCYNPILTELNRLFPTESRTSRRPTCLVPGAGLGRLACEISRLGFICQGNEFSYYMLICSHFLLNHSQSLYEWVFHPWIHTSCNVFSDSDQLRHVAFPDLLPWQAGITEGFSMCAGDFLEIYSSPSEQGTWDSVVTCFFIDTAHNIADYISVISTALKPGGVWINLGPLLYHFAEAYSCSAQDEQSVELSLEDVKRVAKGYGLRLEREERVECTYTANSRSMMRNQYTCAFWTMVKEEAAIDPWKQKHDMIRQNSDLRNPFLAPGMVNRT